MPKRFITGLILALAVAACDDVRTPLAPELPAAQGSVSPEGRRSDTAPVNHVSGTVYLDWAVYGGSRTMFSFNATRDAAGNAKGFFQAEYAYVDDEPGGFRFRADVVCLAVEGRDGWIGLSVTRSEDPVFFPVGTEGVIRIRDAGEGGHIGEPTLDDLLDQNFDGIGDLVTRFSAATCNEKRRAPDFWWLHWIDRGNIQIR
jgi:hypothetical protein